MSTEMVIFKQEGTAEAYCEIQNSWRGAMAIWMFLEKKYLPPFRPSYVPESIPDDDVVSYLGYEPTRAAPLLNQEEHLKNMQEVWDLFNHQEVSRAEKIVLGTTFDYTLVRREDLPEVIEAFLAFEGVTSLPEQAKAMEPLINNESVLAVGWSQNSITENQWTQFNYIEENEEYEPYNLQVEAHFWVLDEIDKQLEKNE